MEFSHDKGYKYFLSNPHIFLDFIKNFVKEKWAVEIDEKSLEKLDKSYIGPDFSEKEADLVYRAKIKDSEVIFYILLELQSTVDYTMPFRLLVYMVYIWMDIIKQRGENEKGSKEFKLPSIVPLVVYNGGSRWNAAREYREIIEGSSYFEGYIPNFRYMLVDINCFSEEELIEIGNTIAAVFLLDQKIGGSELLSRLKKLKDILKEENEEEYKLFKGWLKYILKERLPKKEALEIERIIEESKEVEDMVLNITQTIDEMFNEAKMKGIEEGIQKGMEEGIQKGIEEGIQKGIQKGIEKGKLETAENLLKLGVDIDIILKATGLSEKEIKDLRKKIAN